MIVVDVPTLDPVWIAAVTVALFLSLAHLLFLPGYFTRREMPRPLAYALGLGAIGVAFSLLYLFGRGPIVDHLRPIADFWILTTAGALPTLGFRVAKRAVDNAAALEVVNGKNKA